METINKILKNRLAGAKRIAVLGIGSELRGDDVAGLLVAEELQKKFKKKDGAARLKVFFGATAPENLTGEIKKFKPSHLVIVDTAEMGQKPGTMLMLSPDQVGGGVSFSTHIMPAKVMAEYLLRSLNCEIIIIGIQPGSLAFGKPPSKNIKGSTKEIASAISAAATAAKRKG